MLEPGVVAQVLVALRKRRGGADSVFRKAARSFSLLIIRSLPNSAVQHRAAAGQAFVAGVPQMNQVLKLLRQIDDEVTSAWWPRL